MRATAVDDLGEPALLFILVIHHSSLSSGNLVTLCFEPSESRAEER